MSNFRTTSDLLDGVLRRCGEMTAAQGTSPRLTSALVYLNQLHQTIISGGNELNIDVDENWTWAKQRRPLVISLNPSITAGTVAFTQGSASGTFSAAPTVNGSSASLSDWQIRVQGTSEIYTITSHTAGATAFQIDSAFPQTTVTAANYSAFQLDYDLVPSYLVVDQHNNILDYIANSVSLAVNSATLAQGTYSLSGLATQVATAMNAVADGNTYTSTYDSIQRNYTVVSNTAGTNGCFRPQGAGTNYYRSGWDLLGFDYTNTTGASSYVSTYPQGSIVRLSQPARVYAGYNFYYNQADGQVGAMDPVAFDRAYPLIDVNQGTPTAFCLVQQTRTGRWKVRFNKYLSTTQNMRVEFDYIQDPRDLFNNAASIPLIPKSYRKVLEFGASYYLCLDKNDSRANSYLGIAQQALNAMKKANRRELERTGKDFGAVVARLDLAPNKRRQRMNDYGYTFGT